MNCLFGMEPPAWLTPYLPEGNGWLLAIAVLSLTVVSALVSLAAVAWALTRLPPDYFVNPEAQRPIDRHPMLKVLLLLARNIFGYFLIALGILLSLPGVPGQGLLTIFLGVLLIDFPGKQRTLRWLLTRRGILVGINQLRRRWGHPPLLAPQDLEQAPPSTATSPNSSITHEGTAGSGIREGRTQPSRCPSP
ncbi:MAG: hypothetical protein NZ703_14500 [Gemmataceae bacterium]|nr:hypothetical protein [Gemmataceae bacterium]MCS7272290.1 hypothetical protein [Gemmataceae bacterium]MDW8243962.1 hypothetical protein [Thermogemmata sp.]